MISDAENVSLFLARAKEERALIARPKSKIEPHRNEVLTAVHEKIPIATIQAVLAKHYGLTVSYSNLSKWIKRQPEFIKDRGVIQKPKTKEQLAARERLRNRDPNEPLTLE
jgi:transposase